MKFDFCIGNPPYNETRDNTSDKPIYDEFMEAAFMVAPKVQLITPARFLFNAGRTPKAWNKKMLNDEHFKVLKYENNGKKVFPNTDIKGGVAITYRDSETKFGKIGTFTSYPTLNSIMARMKEFKYDSLSKIMYPYSTYQLSERLFEEHPTLNLSNNKIITTNIFELLNNLFYEEKPDNGDYCCLLGRTDNKRVLRYIDAKYISVAENYDKYKVVIPKSNGSGILGETLSTPTVVNPNIGYTQSFLGIGSLETEDEAKAVLKYISTKFVRVLLGILKITQDNPPEKWIYVPLQDFTSSSDINWDKTIKEIDQQLYKKYNLSDEEITFIESTVKEMA